MIPLKSKGVNSLSTVFFSNKWGYFTAWPPLLLFPKADCMDWQFSGLRYFLSSFYFCLRDHIPSKEESSMSDSTDCCNHPLNDKVLLKIYFYRSKKVSVLKTILYWSDGFNFCFIDLLKEIIKIATTCRISKNVLINFN